MEIADRELVEGAPVVGEIDGEKVVVVRSGGQVHAVSATCTHYGGPLVEGLVEGGRVHCPWHHACFDLATGKAHGPALAPIACYDVTDLRWSRRLCKRRVGECSGGGGEKKSRGAKRPQRICADHRIPFLTRGRCK